VFFFAVGMSLDLATVLRHPGCRRGVVWPAPVKGLIVFVLAGCSACRGRWRSRRRSCWRRR